MGARDSVPIENDLVSRLVEYLRSSGEATDGITCLERDKVVRAADVLENLWERLTGWKEVQR